MSFLERDFIFYPESEILITPAHVGLEYEDVYFETEDGIRLNAWFVSSPGARPTLLFCHGNAGNICHRTENVKFLNELGLNVFIFDYRGYGRSNGKPSEEGIYRDAEAALKYLRSRGDVDDDAIVVFGRSLGSAVAVDLASRQRCAALILESAFSSAADMAKRFFPVLPVSRLIRSKFNSEEKIKNVRVPVLFFHGDRDELIPYEFGQQLYEAANEPKEFYTIHRAGHNDTYFIGGEAYFAKIKEFVTRWLD